MHRELDGTGSCRERMQFEAWAKGFMGLDITPNDSCGYVNPETNGAWLAWGAEARHKSKETEADGWRMVPVEPTIEMLEAGAGSKYEKRARSVWRDMLAAAPSEGPEE